MNLTAMGLIFFLFNNRKPILIITIVGAIASIIVSLVITPRYKSTVIVYPTNLRDNSKTMLDDRLHPDLGLVKFGEEMEADYLVQLLNSKSIKDKLNEKYNLIRHWEIDTAKIPNTMFYIKAGKNIRAKRTRYISIEIEVLDKDPNMSRNIANDMVAFADTIMYNVKKQRLEGIKIAIENELRYHEGILSNYQDSLTGIARKGINEFESQAERFNQAYALALTSGNTAGASRIKQKLDTLAVYGGKYKQFYDQVEYHVEYHSYLYRRLQEVNVELGNVFGTVLLLDSAIKAEVKEYPKRTIMVATVTLASFLFAVIVSLFVAQVKFFKQNT
ncbi:MAG: hypothetical protein HC896_05190 [Bacteroidales bacterium]|nr:hypothetical protein [Bacteroidales bacterium]